MLQKEQPVGHNLEIENMVGRSFWVGHKAEEGKKGSPTD